MQINQLNFLKILKQTIKMEVNNNKLNRLQH